MAMGRGPGEAAPARRHLAGLLLRLLGGVGAAALATYVYLIVVARTVGPVEYASFSAFWAVVVIAGTGIYLPIEQETARRGVQIVDERPSHPLRRSAVIAAAVITLVLAAAVVALWPALSGFFGNDGLLAVALVVGCAGYAVQYPVRGLLSARRQYGRYASVLGSEGLLRVLLVGALVVLADPGVGALACVIGVAAMGSAVVGVVGSRTGTVVHAGGARSLLRSGTVLIVGAVALQTLLYGGVIVARVLAPGTDQAAAGHLLAAITVTRIPVFLFQSMEALVVPRIAELARRADLSGLHAAVLRLLALVSGIAVLTLGGAALAGPELVSLMFGPAYEVSRGTMTLLGLGTGTFMLAVAASDVTVSLGGHRQMATAWVVGLAAATLSVIPLPDLLLRATVPLIVGSTVVALVLLRAARARVVALHPVGV